MKSICRADVDSLREDVRKREERWREEAQAAWRTTLEYSMK
jgi:hypothetical protein